MLHMIEQATGSGDEHISTLPQLLLLGALGNTTSHLASKLVTDISPKEEGDDSHDGKGLLRMH